MKKRKEVSLTEQFVIDRVKELRVNAGMTEVELSRLLGLDDRFVSHVESPDYPDKYNLNHVNACAVILQCSIKALLPREALDKDTKYLSE
ncbi:MAG: XRE family transcriptional regulator [Butyricimonas faecihominis]